ncbi:putative Hydroxymethylglutaryl-coenzyme A synthase N terminal [Leishmania utingensis]|uniref:Hydroxymethylglutaryl-coenzyme A synthase N terminal n=3 Tax=Viannia TaxID=37616 RepID=A0AAW3BSY7_9TRYP|nr:hypothetical protein, conserved [Leishmania guyanensis]
MMRSTPLSLAGVSGMAVYAPHCRVDLEQWCKWTGNNWDKVSSVVGQSFRITNHNENTYTMAANAVLRLIVNNKIDPTKIGFLGLGTESSSDNSAGAIIVKGMVDKGLRALNMPAISRHCEVPEFKHACLAGVYAMESATRFANADGGDRIAIAVASDIAEYALGSTGEQTQGAGATAMMLERDPKLFEVQLQYSGSASDYRGPDFRKPHRRHFMNLEEYTKSSANGKMADFPVFSGPYSTLVYQEEVTVAVEHMLARLQQSPGKYYDDVTALFFHRPYNMMPIQAMSFLYARGLARATSEEHKVHFAELCKQGKADPAAVVKELDVDPHYFQQIESGTDPKDAFPDTGKVAKVLRKDKKFIDLLEKKMSMGSPAMGNFGNLYTASLPCWLAAGFEEAYTRKLDIAGKPMVMVGYGSGDASMSIPIVPVPGWEKAAANINVSKALESPVCLDRAQYEALHTGAEKNDLAKDSRKMEFVIDRLGNRNEATFQDVGVEYYRYIQ